MGKVMTVKSNASEVIKWLDNIQHKELPFAKSLMLNYCAQDIKAAEIVEMKKVFDRPTPYTLNSLMITPATKTKPRAAVWFKDQAVRFMLPHIEGGTREQKRSEKWLSSSGAMGVNRYWIPATRVQNKYGNITGGRITQIMSALHAGPDVTAYRTARSAKRKKNPPEYVPILRKSWLHPGVYQRYARGRIKPVLLFAPNVTYRRRFDFFGVAEKTLNAVFERNWDRAWSYTMSHPK